MPIAPWERGEREMHSDAMACEISGHVVAEDIQELVHAPFLRSSLEMLYPPPYFTVIVDGNLLDPVGIRPGLFVCVRAC